ncbi:MAG TPA: discoidin domain-containing protein [Polyangiaceae bacterium]|nr:discoidin domain-containing protein [Polyangiaceae bacterium]
MIRRIVPRVLLLCGLSAVLAACGRHGSGELDASLDPADAQRKDAATTALRFIALRVENVSATRAVVRFDTSRPATCFVDFGVSPDALDAHATNPDMRDDTLVLVHEVPLEDLVPATTYWFRATATDATGSTHASNVVPFTTTGSTDAASRENVALSSAGTTIAGKSSNYSGAGDDEPFGALKAIDGSMATEWSSDGDGDDAWIELELGQVRSLAAFGFRSRSMSDGTSIVTAVELVLDGTTRLGPYATDDPERTYVFELPADTTARRARLEVSRSTGGNTGAREIQLFAAD